MNKKAIISVVVIIVLIILGYLIWGGKSSIPAGVGAPEGTTSTTTTTTTTAFAPVTADNTDSALLARLQNISVSAAETGSRVALVNGKASFDSGSVKGTAALGNIAVETTVGSTSYVFTTLDITLGGSDYQYAVLLDDTNGVLTDDSYDLIGQNVSITGLRADQISGGTVVTISFMDAQKNLHGKALVVENGAFVPSKDINF